MSYVTIIIPYYKKRKYILRALNSIKKQTFKKYKVLIIYDDETQKDYYYIKKIIKKEKKFFLLKNKKNIGAGYSRNLGIKKSRSKYIAFLDADDYWHKNKLKFQIQFMDKNNYFFTHTDYLIIDDKKKIKGFRKAKEINYSYLLKSCDVGLSSVILRRSLLKNNYFPNIKTKEDFVLWLIILKKFKCKIYPINKTLLFWTDVKNSLSSNIVRKILDSFTVYRKFCKFSLLKTLFFIIILSFNALLKKIYD